MKKLTLAVIAFTMWLLSGCGGYSHLHGAKTVDSIRNILVAEGLCENKLACTNNGKITYDESFGRLDVFVNIPVTSKLIGVTVELITSESFVGETRLHFSSVNSGRAAYIVDIKTEFRVGGGWQMDGFPHREDSRRYSRFHTEIRIA